jgi:hypothetical protein
MNDPNSTVGYEECTDYNAPISMDSAWITTISEEEGRWNQALLASN